MPSVAQVAGDGPMPPLCGARSRTSGLEDQRLGHALKLRCHAVVALGFERLPAKERVL